VEHHSADGEAEDDLPLWFQRGLVVVTAAVLWVGGFGLLLAVLGDYSLAPVLIVGGLGTAATTAVAWPRSRARARARARSRATWPTIAMGLVALASFGWNARYAGHHVIIGRDPGIYAVTGKWIATHGDLEVHTGTDWTSKSANVNPVYTGSYVRGPNVTQYQFDHLTPVLFAVADNIGGDRLLFRVPAILSALALCAIFAVGCRFVRKPWLVLAGVVGLALSLPQINVSRDTFSEPAVQLLLWAGMWLLLLAYERRRAGIAFLAGAALAGTMMSRIDAPIYLIPLPLLAALVWVIAPSAKERRELAKMYGAFVLGAVPVAVLATIDVQRHAGHYYDDLHSQVHELQLGFAASAIAGVLVLLGWPLVRRLWTRFLARAQPYRSPAGWVAGGVVVVAAVAAWVIRPHVLHGHTAAVPLIGGLQQLERLPVDPTRTYAEYSVQWLSWYLGPITIGLAILGAAIVVSRIIRRPDPATVLVTAIAGIGSAVYIWNPSIIPDQIWAMRRFVPAALPFLVLLAALAIGVIGEQLAARFDIRAAVPVLVAGAVVLVAFPLARTWPVRDLQPDAGYLAAVQSTCQVTGPKAALLTVANDFPSQENVGALRSWCDVPVATMNRPFTAAALRALAGQWQAEGRTLWVVGSTPALVAASAPGTAPRLVGRGSSPRELQVTLQRPPRRYQPSILAIYAAQVAS
jgi:hypothetical protein